MVRSPENNSAQRRRGFVVCVPTGARSSITMASEIGGRDFSRCTRCRQLMPCSWERHCWRSTRGLRGLCSQPWTGGCGRPRKKKDLPWCQKTADFKAPDSRQDLPHGLPANVSQAEIAALEAISEPQVIDPQQVENRGVKVVHVNGVLRSVVAQVIGVAVRDSTLDPAAGHPHGKALDVVVPAIS